jgi:hypothetical protein
VLLGWTVLQPSARERRWLLGAVSTCLVVGAALAVAAGTLDPRHPLRVGAAAAVAFVAGLCGIGQLRRRVDRTFELAIRDGRVELRRASAPADLGPPARCVFVAPWLITFRFGSTWVRVWPDSLPPEAFRRVHACVRWQPSGTDPKQLPGPRPETETDA